jgi:nucleotide-binding universal stress UspA family protein
MFGKLLLAVDDSPSGEVAVSFAAAVARQCSAAVHVHHVNEFVVGGRGITLLPMDDAAALVTRAVEELRSAGLRADGSVAVASYREVPQRLVAVAAERGVDAIVLGSRRHRRLRRLFSHQVRERTLRLSPLPVLAAPSPLGLTVPGDVAFDRLAAEAFAR